MPPLKILVADDEPIARKVLTAFLEKEKYEVVIVKDGVEALRLLLAPDAPSIAILDWMMPGLSGLQVCTRLRSASLKIRPYVMMVSAKAAKPDITAALDAGADDYISKPFNPGELMARMRVARRTIDYQLDLQKHIGKLESLAQRYNLLGEIVALHGGRGRADAAAQIAAEEASSKLTPPGVIPVEKVNAIMVRTIAELGLGKAAPAQIEQDEAYHPLAFTAWGGLILLKDQIWIDLLLELDAAAAGMIFHKMLKRVPSSDRETLDFLAETHTIVCAAFRAELQAKGAEVLSPLLSRALRTGDAHHRVLPVPKERETFTYGMSGGALRLTIVRGHDCVESKTAGQLHDGDILAEPFPPPEVSDIPLLSQGMILNDRFIEKLSVMAESELKTLLVPVLQLPPVASYFVKDGS
jgi:sigma-B regulation protein RsbU (phosphoserine phosphatase)